MIHRVHSDSHASKIDPDGNIGKPAELLKCSNLPKSKPSYSPNERANNIAELELHGLRQSLPVGDYDTPDIQNQLNRLQDVEQIACPRPKQSKSQVTV